MSENTAAQWLTTTIESKVIPFMEEKGIKVPKGIKVLLSFPSRGGENVEPETTKDGNANPKAGEAKVRFQFIPTAKLEKNGKLSEKRKGDAVFSKVSHGGRIAGDVPTLLISPAKHNPWKGSIFGSGNAPQAEVAQRLLTALHGLLFAHVVELAPGKTLTKNDKVKVYNGHFESLGVKLGLMGKGWTSGEELTSKLVEWSKGAPKDAAVNLFPADAKEENAMSSVTLQAADGTLVSVSARAIPSKKGKAAGQQAALAILQTGGPFTYVKDSLSEKLLKNKAEVPSIVAEAETFVPEVAEAEIGIGA
jgi:hypothetical protein